MKRAISLIVLICMSFTFSLPVLAQEDETVSAYGELLTSTEQILSETFATTIGNYQKIQKFISRWKKFDYKDYIGVLPILYLDGDNTNISKDTSVAMSYRFEKTDGTTFLPDGVCDLKWQGSSSLAYPKKNYTIKFQEGFEAVEGWGEEKKYCIKANFMDFSHARNVGSARLWGQIVQTRNDENPLSPFLDNLPNSGAVDGFPIVIVLNGVYQGLHTFNVPKDGWMFKMEDEGVQTQAIVGADNWSDATYFKSAATFDGDFEVEHNSNESVSEDITWIKDSINRMLEVCMASNGEDLDTTVNQYIDLDSAIDYYIFTTLIGAFDAYGKNYLLATFDGNKWFFSAYDMDTTFGINYDGSAFVVPDMPGTGTLLEYGENHLIMGLILKYKRDALIQRYWDLRETVLSEENVIGTMRSVMEGVPREMFDADKRIWETIPSTDKSNITQIEEWYKRRVVLMDEQVRSLTIAE